ncbi:Tim44 domain-containing protein, partial [Escherichia coli]
QIEESFPLIQEAWMNRDYSPVKHLMTDNFFDTHTVKMNWMLLKKEKNILSDVELKKVTPILAVENDENGEDFIWVL